MTAERIFHGINDYEVRSAGTETGARIEVTSGLIRWADLIFCMEKKHVRRLQEKFSSELMEKRIICLGIPDEYVYMDEELIEILKSNVSAYIEIPD
ncbi:protein tyrosine phosphatase [Brevibacillus fortis]|uniref:protein tyrosine phosphatase n=1 Tax=Brevibacillus fortis TaxID=2126352 RepID=UPI0038FD30AF